MPPTSDRTTRIRYSSVLYLLTSLFLLRVAGQAIQYWFALDSLPPFDAFQGSSLPYAVLLSVQLLLLVAMYRAAWRLGSAKLPPNRRTGRWLVAAGSIYMAGSLARITIGLTVTGANGWFTSWIPALLHVVLAAFVLTLAIFHLWEKENYA